MAKLILHYGRQETIDSEECETNKKITCWKWLLSLFRFGNIEEGMEDDVDHQGEVSEIKIKNSVEGKPDHHLGLRLRTYQSENEVNSTRCYRHIIEYTKTNGPGEDMNIKNGDELLTVYSNFVPGVEHKEVMIQLYNLKVDGQSTIKMIIRRRKRSGKWKWLEIAAILASCKSSDNDTEVHDPECNRVKKNRLEFESDHVYRFIGTQRFMVIDDRGLQSDTMSDDSGDKTKVMQRRTVIFQQGERLNIEVSLCDKTMSRYITFCPLKRKIILSETPQWFLYGQLGNETHFLSSDGYFIGYDDERNKVKPQRERYAFEEFPVPGYLKKLFV